MLDYVVKETELPKGFTLGDYVKLKGLSEKDWLLIYDENEKLLTGVRADGLMASEKNYYIVTVQHHIFPIYVSHSDRGYYIVVYISRTSVDVIPKVCTLTEVQVPEDTEKPSEMVDTNIGEMPVEDYKDIVAIQNGFNNYDDMLAEENTSEPERPVDEDNQVNKFTSLSKKVCDILINLKDGEFECLEGERNILINLTNEDCELLAIKAGSVGLTVGMLLRNFISDLVDGHHSNGSDERMLANEWFNRCWFSSSYSDETLLQYLLTHHGIEDLEYFIELEEEINALKANDYDEEDLKDLLNDYHSYVDDFCEKYSNVDIENEIFLCQKWLKEYNSFFDEKREVLGVSK